MNNRKQNWSDSNIFKALKKIFDLYTSDLNSKDVEKLIIRDVPGMYQFYLRNMDKPIEHKNKLYLYFNFFKNLFISFLRKLSPIVRIFYSVALLLIVYGYFTDNWNPIFLSILILNIILIFEVAEKLTAKNELDIAREVQINLLPKEVPQNLHYDISFHSEFAQEVGGDYIDFLNSNDNNLTFLAIGDMSGKGMKAAIYISQIKAMFQFIIQQHTSPIKILKVLNNSVKNSFNSGSFFSVSLLCINQNKKLSLCRAGHTPLIYYNALEKACKCIRPNGIAIGLNYNGVFDNSLEEIELILNKDDILFLYTDGLTEAMNTKKAEFGEERIKQIIYDNPNKTSLEIKNKIISEIEGFRRFALLHDDLSMIVIKGI